MRTTLVDAVRQVFEQEAQPVPQDFAQAGLSIADTLATVPPEEQLSIIARDWPKAKRLMKQLAESRGVRTDEAGSRLADGIARALQQASAPQHWLNANKVRKVLAQVDFKLDPDFRALNLAVRSPELERTLQRVFGRHFEEKLDARAGEWFASLQLFAREHAAAATTSEQEASTYRDRRKDELAQRVRRDYAEYSDHVRDLLAQIDGTTMATFEPLAPADASSLRDLIRADASLVQSYVETLFQLMDLDPPPTAPL